MSKCNSVVIVIAGRRIRVYRNEQRGFWYASYMDAGLRKRVTLHARTKPEAEDAVHRLFTPQQSSADVSGPRLTWEQVQTMYLAFKTNQGKAPKSISRFKAGLEAFGRYLKSLDVSNADTVCLTVLEGYIQYRTKTEQCDVKTAYTDALILKNLFKWACLPARGLLKDNPASAWETSEPVKPKRKTYSAQAVAALESGARPWLRPIITTLAYTGLRIGELVSLRWEDVDLKQNVLHVRIREDWKPKGRRDRTIPLHPKVRVALEQQPIGLYVFRGPRGGRIKENNALECLKRDQRKLNLPEGDLHGFRRFFATAMLKAGVSIETVRQWGGWASLETMMRYLADLNVTDSVQAMQKASKRMVAAS